MTNERDTLISPVAEFLSSFRCHPTEMADSPPRTSWILQKPRKQMSIVIEKNIVQKKNII
jgi:hypothetical protein